jgi:hypothetical protein
VVERMFGANYHPVWTMIASCVLMLAGLITARRNAAAQLTILIYGGGYGIMDRVARCRSRCSARNATRR